ncbi:MAG: hypothetical protein GY758_16290 [Fuerstiella sp.]|nr:hypothetical protein [Fuerstiella sp.]MCP4505017.1 hypothetical protein [Fuerstiella sp.]
MGRYWIRNRGRTQGPLTADKIHGLLRRGRFNRHYQVSEDRKNWYVATDFPELFPEAPSSRGGRGGGDDYEDDYDGGGGGSLFDDDYESESAPPKRRGRKRSRDEDAPRNSPFDNEDEDEDDDDYDDESDDRDEDDDYNDDDDEDWDDEGAVYRLIGWIEQKWQGIVVLLVAVMIGLGWFVFYRETFVQDQQDLDLLMELHGKVTSTHSGGVASNEWSRLTDDTTAKLQEIIERLTDPSQASARDHVKQELLFAARDDFRRMFDELPKGQNAASQRMLGRFRDIEAMITARTRQNKNQVAPPPVQTPAQPPAAESPGADMETGPAAETQNNSGATPQRGNAGDTPAGANSPATGSRPPDVQ